MSANMPDPKSMFTKEEVEALIEKTLKHFRNEMESMLNDKLKAFQEKQKFLEDKYECLEMNFENLKDKAEHDRQTMIKDIEHLRERCTTLEVKMKMTATKSNENEQYSRRNHLRFWGVKINQGETAACAIVRVVNNKLVIQGADGQRLLLTPQHIEVAHTLRPPQSAQPGRPDPIIVRFFSRNVRDRIIAARRQLKSTNPASPKITISEDLTRENQNLLNELKKCSIVENCWSWNGKVFYTLTNDKRRHQLKLFDDLPKTPTS